MGSEAKWPICIGCLPKADSQQPAQLQPKNCNLNAWQLLRGRYASLDGRKWGGKLPVNQVAVFTSPLYMVTFDNIHPIIIKQTMILATNQ
ncbi:MAG: hypothetical protein CL820_02510 [Croceicoccus sp.]|jgi:hypothetical protein|nr:hypothetical protein [Erythrobacteraceae bacterium]MAL24757.1 hypothetical protein [Croceicoccus sp.]PNQ77790.1 hypothetical protein BA950_01830 [Erythrobacter sp. SAORIC-644]